MNARRRSATLRAAFSLLTKCGDYVDGTLNEHKNEMFHPKSGSDSMTARSSTGLSFSSLGAIGGPMTRNASSHELKYAGYTIRGVTENISKVSFLSY